MKFSAPSGATAALLWRDGRAIFGLGFGAATRGVGELCFQTSMTGYQEIITDPSYASQIVVFTFPHVGVVGTNDNDWESEHPRLSGIVLRQPLGAASNYRSQWDLQSWLVRRGIPAIAGVDTRELTCALRDKGTADALLVHCPDGQFPWSEMHETLERFEGIRHSNLAKTVATSTGYPWSQALDPWPAPAYHHQPSDQPASAISGRGLSTPKIVVLDCGVKHNILRHLASKGARVQVLPLSALADRQAWDDADGILLTNGPGDPEATANDSELLRCVCQILEAGKPVMGICLGHQLLGMALGCRTIKMPHGHHGANHPVMNLRQSRVEITAQNHVFSLDPKTIPDDVAVTHVSLFDGSVAGIRSMRYPAFSVQYHPESSPGPHDSGYLFDEFFNTLPHGPK